MQKHQFGREPRSASEYLNAGDIYLSAAHYRSAAQAYSASIEMGMRDPRIFVKLASAYYQAGDLSASKEIFSALLAQWQEFPQSPQFQEVLPMLRAIKLVR